MKIAIFTNNYLPNPFGVSSSIESFRKEFERDGHEVYIFAPKTKGYQDENPNVFRYPSIDFRYKISFPLAIPYSKKINKILEKLEIDIIHSQHPNLLGSVAKKWAEKKQVPLIFTWHTLYDKYTHFVPIFVPKKFIGRGIISNAVSYANKADVVIAPTPSVARIIKDWGVCEEKILSLATGVERIFENADKEKIRKKYKIKKETIVLGVVSRFTQEKNIKFLFKVMITVLKKRSAVVFLVKGSGDLLEEMKNYVDNEKLTERVIFTDQEDRKEDVFAAIDIFVYASKSETQGMVIAEAMYSGAAIVAVEATGISDFVINGTNGFLVQQNEEEFSVAVRKIIDNQEVRKNFSNDAKKRIRDNYTAQFCAKKLLEIYAKAIANKKGKT